MSRTCANAGLQQLMLEKDARQRVELGLPFRVYWMPELEVDCDCSRQQIHNYSTGRKALPYIERKMAAAFGIGVTNLRLRLFGTAAVFAERKGVFVRKQPKPSRRPGDDARHDGPRQSGGGGREEPVRKSNLRKMVQE